MPKPSTVRSVSQESWPFVLAEPALNLEAGSGHRGSGPTGVVVDVIEVDAHGSAHFPTAEAALDQGDALVELVDLHAEGIKLIFELDDELFQHFDVLLAGFGHVDDGQGAGEGGSHLVTGGGLLAFVGAVRITGEDSTSGQLADGVISPVVQGNVHEGIGGRERGSRESDEHCNCCQHYDLFHYVFNPLEYVLPLYCVFGFSIVVRGSRGFEAKWPCFLFSLPIVSSILSKLFRRLP